MPGNGRLIHPKATSNGNLRLIRAEDTDGNLPLSFGQLQICNRTRRH
jgi:hypothetical protein